MKHHLNKGTKYSHRHSSAVGANLRNLHRKETDNFLIEAAKNFSASLVERLVDCIECQDFLKQNVTKS